MKLKRAINNKQVIIYKVIINVLEFIIEYLKGKINKINPVVDIPLDKPDLTDQLNEQFK